MFCKTSLKLSVVAVLATFGAHAAYAQEQTLPQVKVQANAERADGPVTGYRATRSATFTKTDTPLKEVPASVTVVPAELMKDQAVQGMSDVLRYVPGVIAAQGEGNRDQIVIRGINTTSDFFVDGIRDDAQTYRDVYNLERVEVLKGPGGMVFGRGGAGGVVNRVTKKPVFGSVNEVSFTLGSYNQLRGTADIGNKLTDSAAWRVNVMAEDKESFRNGVESKRYAVNPTLTFLLTDRTSLTVSYEHMHDERTADRGLPSRNNRPFNTSRSTFFGNADQSESKITINGFSAALDHDLGGGLQLKNNFRITHYDKFYQNVYAGGAVGGTGTMSISAYNSSNDRTNYFNQTDLTAKFNTGGIEHTFLAGIELGYQESVNTRKSGFFGPTGAATSATVSASNPYAAATSFRFAGTDANNKYTAQTAAIYFQDQIALTQNWKLLGGMRYDRYKVQLFDRKTTAPALNLESTDYAWSPRLGLIWTPTPASTYYASYSYAFLPSGESLSLANNTADLAPEKSRNYEVGGRWDVMPKLTLSAAVFRLDRDNVRTTNPLNPALLVQTGQQRTEGVELGLQGEVTRDWEVFAGYANLDGRITKTTSSGPAGAKIGLVPEHTLSVWNKLNVGGGWAAGLGVIHQSESYTSFTNTVKLPAFTRLDGAVFYTFAGGKTRLALNVENLLDRKYYPTAHSDNNISPGAPRNARLTLVTSF